MKALSLLAAGTALALTAPVAAQTMDHSMMPGMAMPGMTMPAAPTKKAAPPKKAAPAARSKAPARPKPAAPACAPEHAAMGHCTPATAAPEAADGNQHVGGSPDPAASADPACPPEHAAMGHCTPKAAAPMLMPMPAPAPAADPACPPEHAAMGHCKPAPAVMPDMAMGTGGTALPAGNAPAPAPMQANYADRIWGREAMASIRSGMMKEHGGMSFSQVMFNLAEVQVRNGRDGYRWDGEAWFGGDINRLTVKSEGEGAFREGVEGAEVQALYSRAIGPYFNLQAGVRHDFKPSPTRTYATLGFEGLAPYWFEIEGAAFVSDKGDVLGRLEGYYDQRVTQRLVLQPRVELNLSAQDMRAERIGSGLTDAEVGLRLRYEIRREFAPYVGVSWERKFGDTARFARADGEGTGGFAFVSGIRVWF